MSESADWYTRWASRHCEIFCLHGEQVLTSFLAWRDLFAAAGYTEQDLVAATAKMAVGRPPRYASEHRLAIQRVVAELHAIELRREIDRPDRGQCATCNGSGRVTVPHLAGVSGGEWVPVKVARGGPSWYQTAVLCLCPLGRWFFNRIPDPEKRPMSLDFYEAKNPRWRVQMEKRRREQIEEAKLIPDQKGWRELMRRLLDQYTREPGQEG